MPSFQENHGLKTNVYSIPPRDPFLKVLAQVLMDGRLICGLNPREHPEILAKTTIFVPTHRAVRVLREEIISLFGGQACLLPHIKPLGDVDEEELETKEQCDDGPDVLRTIGTLEQHLVLTCLIQAWSHQLADHDLELLADETIRVPSSISDAAWLSNDLIALIRDMEMGEISWKQVETLVPEEYARWWSLTLAFLQIAMTAWPEYLREAAFE